MIYFFNTLHKTGAPWRDGTAVYYFLQQDRLITAFGAWLREVLPLGALKSLTYSTLVIEGAIAALLLVPFKPHAARMVAFGLALVLHVSIDSVLQLGAFSWAMVVVFFLFVPAQAWDWLANRRAKSRVPCTVHFDAQSGASLLLCRLVKRLDGLGLVSYRVIDEHSPKRVRKTLAVSQDGRVQGGFSALLSISDALWFGRKPLRLLGALGFRRRIERRLARLATAPEALDEDLGVGAFPHEADAFGAPPSEARQFLRTLCAGPREALVLVLLVVCGSQVLMENAAVPGWLKVQRRPEFFQAIIEYPRIFQGWSMFAPSPPLSDGRLVIDGRTQQGRRLDPLTGKEPVFQVQPPGSPRMNLIWGYFHTRIAEDRFSMYWNGVRDYVLNQHKRSGLPGTAIVAFDAYFVSQEYSAPGQKRAPPQRRKLFSHGNMLSVGTPSAPPTE